MTKLLGPDEERFRALADSAPVLIWMSDISGGGIYFNRAWLDFTGRPLEREAVFYWGERDRQLEGESPFDNLMEVEVIAKRKGRRPWQAPFTHSRVYAVLPVSKCLRPKNRKAQERKSTTKRSAPCIQNWNS